MRINRGYENYTAYGNIANQVELMKVTSPIEQKNWKLGTLVIG